jgi:hypothetical protein
MFVFTLIWGHAEHSDFRCWYVRQRYIFFFFVIGNLMIWKATPLCMLWTVWNERNIRTFGGVEESNHVIKQVMLHMTVLGSIPHLLFLIFF